MTRIIRPFGVLMFAAVAGFALEASAAEVRAGISTRETYVGLPVTFQIQVNNATKSAPPAISEVDGLTIKSLGTPSRSTQTTIINGSMSSTSSVIYSYEVTPQHAGRFRIPPISISADGQRLETRAFDFVASKSETGDLLFVEIAGKEKEIYVGQSLGLTLKIWVRPYHDKEYNVMLSEADMWHSLSERTSWGAFSDRINELAANNERPVGTEVLRKDREGIEHSYYLYEIAATIYPKKPGKIDANDVKIVFDYPTALGQSRDPFGGMLDDMGFSGRMGGMFGNDGFSSPFGSRLAVESVRPIVAEAKVEPIEVLDIPVAGRPADYRGAVGKYIIASRAEPTDVKAGDPIKLSVGIAGTGPMDLVQAPPLAELPSLTADFKVPNEPLAGYVQGAQKVFSTTIRPRQAGITEIPPIPFSYFDPEIGKFVTARSDPISIHVEPADTLALADVVGRSQAVGVGASGNTTNDAADAAPVLAIFTGNDLLTNEAPSPSISTPLVVFLALPPLVVLGLFFARSRSGLSAVAFQFGSSAHRFHSQIEAAEQPADVARALRSLLARRFGVSNAAAETATLVGALRTAGYRTIAVRCERILAECERSGAGAYGVGLSLADLKRDAISLIDDLESQRRPTRLKPVSTLANASRLRTTTSSIVTAVALAGALLIGGGDAQAAVPTEVTFTTAQQQTLLTEANERYNLALSTAESDSAEAKQSFADAAEKYQLLADSGVHNSRLYFNLANAYLEGGATGRAIANYRRSLQLDPTNDAARTNLAHAESRLSKPATADATQDSITFTSITRLANDRLNRHISPTSVLVIAVVAWFVLWTAIGLRLCDVHVPWKSIVTVSLLLAATAATSYALSRQVAAQHEAVVVTADASLRTGDGENFPDADGSHLVEGQSVEWLKRRGDWVQVRTAAGQGGWLLESAVEIL